MKIAVLGAGAWGTAMAVACAAENEVTLWCRDPRQLALLRATRENERYLRGIRLPGSISLTDQIDDAIEGTAIALIAVPMAALRPTLRRVRASSNKVGFVWLCKGFEAGSTRLPHQVAAEELPGDRRCAALSGPSFADEVARGLPSAVTLASFDGEFAASAARQLHTGRLRIYSSEDLIGVEVGGAVKNVIAIAAGICDGLRLGHSARAALITRGLTEVTRLGLRVGGRIETFMGLSGVGDLTLTCTSDLSRNRRIGLALASGKPLPQALSELGHVAEGVHTAREVRRMADDLGIEMPITRAVAQVLEGVIEPKAAVEDLLQREPKAEGVGL
ncbi:MAG: NAD(P)H-dependent glycerol-3-phosphate dehydrogenase [Burkholderiales bacterium]